MDDTSVNRRRKSIPLRRGGGKVKVLFSTIDKKTLLQTFYIGGDRKQPTKIYEHQIKFLSERTDEGDINGDDIPPIYEARLSSEGPGKGSWVANFSHTTYYKELQYDDNDVTGVVPFLTHYVTVTPKETHKYVTRDMLAQMPVGGGYWIGTRPLIPRRFRITSEGMTTRGITPFGCTSPVIFFLREIFDASKINTSSDSSYVPVYASFFQGNTEVFTGSQSSSGEFKDGIGGSTNTSEFLDFKALPGEGRMGRVRESYSASSTPGGEKSAGTRTDSRSLFYNSRLDCGAYIVTRKTFSGSGVPLEGTSYRESSHCDLILVSGDETQTITTNYSRTSRTTPSGGEQETVIQDEGFYYITTAYWWGSHMSQKKFDFFRAYPLYKTSREDPSDLSPGKINADFNPNVPHPETGLEILEDIKTLEDIWYKDTFFGAGFLRVTNKGLEFQDIENKIVKVKAFSFRHSKEASEDEVRIIHDYRYFK